MNNDEQKQTQKMAYVYKIESVDGSVRYIGSTKNRLCSRMAQHRSTYRAWKAGNRTHHCTSFNLFDKVGIENCGIYPLEEVPFTTTLALHQVERKWILALECVNKYIPARTSEELRKAFSEYGKKRREAHPGYMKEWREAHPDYYSNWGRKPVQCECGTTVKRHSLPGHLLSAKHDRLMEKKSTPPAKVVELPK